ncbi:tRNA-splicing endonuclease subunit Sen54 [Anthophora quadrimaculata]
MAEETRKFPNHMLTAEELLENKGLKYNAWNEYETSAKTLPKTGMKQFEPNNSWLQNIQIEKGIMTRRNLIAIERVDRISQLASAEWLPAQKRAKVKKHSGQDWSSFGLEKDGALYLIPEEALFLLETNCLELTWNDVPLSIQQAYELLIDNVECTLEEYRVYSQLVRYGYRIQRFIYNSERNAKSDESINVKRKVIVEPENGLRMSDIQQQNNDCTNANSEKCVSPSENIDRVINNSPIEIYHDATEHKNIPKDVNKVANDLCAVESIEDESKSTEHKDMENMKESDINLQATNTNEDKKKRNCRVEIISEETLLGTIKIVTDHIYDSTKGNNTLADWRASRIQRNVKLLPKRTDKISSTESSDSSVKNSESSAGKHKSFAPFKESLPVKKSKHEIIELSDDEVQEVPKPMSRMDLLNLIPNIAFQSTITVKISRGYIPHSIKPQKTIYHYESGKLRNLQQIDKRLRSGQNLEHSNNNSNQNQYNNTCSNNNARRNTNVIPFNQNSPTNMHNALMQDCFSMQHRQHGNFGPIYMYNNRQPYMYNQNLYWQHRNTMFQNVFVGLDNHNTAIHQNRFMSVQMNNLSVPNISNNTIRHFFTRNQVYHNFHQNSLSVRKLYHQRITENTSIHCSVARNVLLPDPRQRYWPRNNHRSINILPNSNDEVYQSSFKVLPGASSWTELKAKWREEKTITIDDEDTEKEEIEDSNEIQVVRQLRSPLIGPKNANSLEEVFSKLKIIKSAPEKVVRRRKNKYKISYNIYSNTQNYRKANPGLPFYRVVVVRQDDPFIQPIELHRLLQDANNSPILLACVSMTISYIQSGFISIPNLA